MSRNGGIAAALGAYGCLATEAILIHSSTVGALQIALLRSFGCVALVLVISIVTKKIAVRSVAPRVQITRSLLGALGFLGAIYAFGHAPLAAATALTYTRALWMTLFAMLFMGESPRPAEWAGVAAGMAGAMAIIQPGFAAPNLGCLAALGAAVIGAAAAVGYKQAIALDSVNTTMWWVAGANLAVTFPAIGMSWNWPDPQLVGIMILGPLGTYLLLVAIGSTAISIIAPFEYTRLIVVVAGSLILFHELPSVWAWCGMSAIIIGCCLSQICPCRT
jgi:drug/metabolite transporter (DMT)-like permease